MNYNILIVLIFIILLLIFFIYINPKEKFIIPNEYINSTKSKCLGDYCLFELTKEERYKKNKFIDDYSKILTQSKENKSLRDVNELMNYESKENNIYDLTSVNSKKKYYNNIDYW